MFTAIKNTQSVHMYSMLNADEFSASGIDRSGSSLIESDTNFAIQWRLTFPGIDAAALGIYSFPIGPPSIISF